MALLQSLSTRGKITLGGCALAFVAACLLLFQLSSRPSWQTVASGIDPAQSGKVTAALDQKGIAWKLENGGTALAVEAAEVDAARIAMAQSGVAGGIAQQPGFELLEKQKLGTSSFQQQVAYQRALEGQIAQTVSQINGVGSAQVRLTMPKDELFTDEKKPASAAVLLGGGDVDPGAVKGIANLVASSVPDLDAKNVTITDASGALMWPTSEASGGGASKQSAEARYEAQTVSSLDAMLARALGPDKAQVRVSAELDVDQTTQEKLEYADRGTPLTSVEENETLRGTGGAGRTAGAGSNIPSFGAGAAGGNSNYRKSSVKTDFGVDKTITRTRKAPGQVMRQSVSVLVDANTRPTPQALAALRASVEAAVGAQAGRDTVTVQAIPFAKLPQPEDVAAGPIPALPKGATGLVKGVGIGVGALVFLFFVTRHLRRREDEALADKPSWLLELEQGRTRVLDAGPPAQRDEDVGIPPMADFEDPRKIAIQDLVEREPERVAAQLRSWITTDR